MVPLELAVDEGLLVRWPREFVGCNLLLNTNLNETNWMMLAGVTHRYMEEEPLAFEKYFKLQPSTARP